MTPEHKYTIIICHNNFHYAATGRCITAIVFDLPKGMGGGPVTVTLMASVLGLNGAAFGFNFFGQVSV